MGLMILRARKRGGAFPLFTFTLPSLGSSAITQGCTWLPITRRS